LKQALEPAMMIDTFQNKALPAVRACGLALALLVGAPAAQAQYTNTLSGLNYSSPYAANAAFFQQQMQQNAYFQMQMQLRAGAQASSTAPKAAAPVLKAPPHSFKYPMEATDFSPAGKRNMAEQFAANAKTPEERAQVVALCRSILQSIESQPGVRKNNLSTALTVLLGLSLQVSTGRELSDAESEGLQRTINDVLADATGLRAMSNAKRTAAYDAFLITGGLIAGMAQNATEKGDTAQLQQAKDMARQSIALFMR
jgi:hypothetical protein